MKEEALQRFKLIIRDLQKHGNMKTLKRFQAGEVVKWCGFMLIVIDAGGLVLIKPDADKLKTITESLILKNRSVLRCFLGIKMQIQGWIPTLNWTCKDLHKLTSESVV